MAHSTARTKTVSRKHLLPGFYVFVVKGGIDPLLYGPRFSSAKERDAYMHDIYPTKVNEDDGDLPCWLTISQSGRPTIGYYPRDAFAPETEAGDNSDT